MTVSILYAIDAPPACVLSSFCFFKSTYPLIYVMYVYTPYRTINVDADADTVAIIFSKSINNLFPFDFRGCGIPFFRRRGRSGEDGTTGPPIIQNSRKRDMFGQIDRYEISSLQSIQQNKHNEMGKLYRQLLKLNNDLTIGPKSIHTWSRTSFLTAT